MQNLEDYIVEMENRKVLDNSSVPEEFWTQLQQKENDLVLAAEFGKALLDKNEELQRQIDANEKEFTKKLEIIEQDRHLLKRKLASIESECELRVLELQNDVKELQEKLLDKETSLKQTERDKSSLLDDLQRQNARLSQELKQYASNETQLLHQLDEIRRQSSGQKKNLQEYATTINSLKDEIDMVTEKRDDLERRLRLLAGEREELTINLEEASDRIMQLERHAREQDYRYQQSIKEYSLPNEKLSIEDRMSEGKFDQRSILAEMDVTEPNLSQECMSIYRQMRSLCQQLKSHNDDDDSGLHSDCSTISMEENQHFSTGLLTEVAQQLVGLVLDSDIVNLIERIERYRRDLQERDIELQRKSDIIRELTSRVSVCEVELQAALEERDRARNDVNNTSTAQDEIVVKAREIRDQAVTRRNKAEVELAKTRVELMQANSQLLEAIQQKVELSQQLEQWQMDMQELLDEQLKNKLTSQEIKMKNSQNQQQPVAPTRRKLLGFFQR
nr:bicaudal D-related protein homolog [Onthophagus taurus]